MSDAPALSEVPNNKDQHKDSCQYAVDTAKQFLSLAAAGVAFVVGLVMAGATSAVQPYYWAAGLFVASVLFGLIFVMSVVAHVNQCNNYDVYTPVLKFLSLVQIICFVAATVVVTFVVLKPEGQQIATFSDRPDVTVIAGSRQISHKLPDGGAVRIKVSGNDEIEVNIDTEKFDN